MAWFLFIDESGQDRRESPYEVLAGVAVKDEYLWRLVNLIHAAEFSNFGRRYSQGVHELKALKLLNRRVFQHSELSASVGVPEIPGLAKEILDDGAAHSNVRHLKALALAKLSFVNDVFGHCVNMRCRVFGSVVEIDAPPTTSDGLRKDYGYLFERFYYFLEDETERTGTQQQGVLVFDELEKSKSHILIEQAHRYFKDTQTGRQRSSLIVPEPFFVHSDLTTGVQLADLVAYCLSWGFRLPTMTKPSREELKPYVEQIRHMRYRTVRKKQGVEAFEIWSIQRIADLRTSVELSDIGAADDGQ